MAHVTPTAGTKPDADGFPTTNDGKATRLYCAHAAELIDPNRFHPAAVDALASMDGKVVQASELVRRRVLASEEVPSVDDAAAWATKNGKMNLAFKAVDKMKVTKAQIDLALIHGVAPFASYSLSTLLESGHLWTNEVETWARDVAAVHRGEPRRKNKAIRVDAHVLITKFGAAPADVRALPHPTTASEAATVQIVEQWDARAWSDARNGYHGERRLAITWASEIEPEPVDWLWVDIATHNAASVDPFLMDDIASVPRGRTWVPPEVETDGRIPCGMMAIAAGREGTGKSSFGIWLAARVTRGTLPGAFFGTPRRVFYLATEDSWKHTLAPRLIAAGADMAMVGKVDVMFREESTVTLSLPDDVDALAQSISEHEVALVVIDPLMSTLGSGLSANDSRDVRTALEPIAAMAEKTGAAVVGIAHFNKSTGVDPLSRITGSGAFKDLPRAVMVFARNADNGHVFTQQKNSCGRLDLPSLTYAITPEVVQTPTGPTSTGKFTFTEVADQTVDDVLADERRRAPSPAVTFLVAYITEHADPNTGEVNAADAIAAGRAEGFSEGQIVSARSRSRAPGIATRRVGFGGDGGSLWRLEQRQDGQDRQVRRS
jgi:hypothetical protein